MNEIAVLQKHITDYRKSNYSKKHYAEYYKVNDEYCKPMTYRANMVGLIDIENAITELQKDRQSEEK